MDDEEGEENNEADESNDIWLETTEDDEAETLYFDEEGRAGTTILGDQIQRKSGTGESIAYAGPGQTVTDTIEYHGLTPGKSYTVKGWLVDAETNAAAKGASSTETRTESAQTAAASGRDKNSRHPVQNDCCQCVLYDVKI